MKISTRFTLGEKVTVDGCKDIIATVIAFELRAGCPNVHRYELSWWHNGDVKFSMFDEFRLTHFGWTEQPKVEFEDKGS